MYVYIPMTQLIGTVHSYNYFQIYLGGIVYFGVNCGFASISGFLPTIIKSFGFSNPSLFFCWVAHLIYDLANAIAQLLTVPPYAVAGLILIVTSYASDRTQNRGFFLAAANTISGIGHMYARLVLKRYETHSYIGYKNSPRCSDEPACTVLCCVLRNFGDICVHRLAYCLVFVLLSSRSVSSISIHSLDAHNLGSETKRATGMPLFMAIGLCGSILGSHIFPLTEAPLYTYVIDSYSSVLSPLTLKRVHPQTRLCRQVAFQYSHFSVG